MRTLTEAALAAVAARITQPLYLIEIGFEPVARRRRRIF